MPQKQCAFEGCKKKIKPTDEIMGQCLFEGIYFKKHRLPEQHGCSFQFTINKDDFIAANKCVASKIETA